MTPPKRSIGIQKMKIIKTLVFMSLRSGSLERKFVKDRQFTLKMFGIKRYVRLNVDGLRVPGTHQIPL